MPLQNQKQRQSELQVLFPTALLRKLRLSVVLFCTGPPLRTEIDLFQLLLSDMILNPLTTLNTQHIPICYILLKVQYFWMLTDGAEYSRTTPTLAETRLAPQGSPRTSQLRLPVTDQKVGGTLSSATLYLVLGKSSKLLVSVFTYFSYRVKRTQ